MWEYWCKAIGQKAYDDDDKADTVAIISVDLGCPSYHHLPCNYSERSR